jgi:hypothetical protein
LLASGQQRKAGEQTNVFFHTPYSYFSAKFGRLSGRNIPVAGDLRLGMSFAAALRASRKIAVAASLCEAPHAVAFFHRNGRPILVPQAKQLSL